MNVYDEESVKKIITEFRDLLKDADNFPRDKAPNDYREFWTGLRGKGSSILGLANHLIEVINKKEDNAEEKETTNNKEEEENS